MKTIIELIQIIKEEFVKIFGEDIEDIRLEELSRIKGDSSDAYITMSFLIPNKNYPQASLGRVLGSPYIRQYKDVHINRETGELLSITIHKNE